ncbi:Lrp/AsnC family transcriptional regulator [Rhodococcus sp. T2V]|uniref:Lrp/AsnC family transcriptional regulator n=1 Tax=Rhodococcus sp. T2V TaxID=3034164 RepID=UPI0023E24DE8|nr:AsnC family transcriptional regulator [Rhodococcus sp. T2V]MDF3309110.1 AsnC family transcriptional regulator [Rhodococcus sp. T2V]
MPEHTADPLDRKIIAALTVDGRATWSTIAAALGEAERTVARRGARLLETGMVEVRGMADPHRTADSDPFIVHGRCRPDSTLMAAVALAHRPESVTVYVLSGPQHCYADIWAPRRRQSRLFLQEMATPSGFLQMDISPVLEYIRTLHDWEPGILTETQTAQIRRIPKTRWPQFTDPVALDREDKALVRLVVENGRASFEELSRLVGISEQTVKRRLDKMRQSGLLTFRAVFDPALIGLPVAALLWIRTKPSRVSAVAEALAGQPFLRYAAIIMGDHQIVADFRLPSKEALRELMLEAEWLEHVDRLESSLILETLKQSRVLASDLG